MDSILLSLNVVAPLAGTVFLGYFFHQARLMQKY